MIEELLKYIELEKRIIKFQDRFISSSSPVISFHPTIDILNNNLVEFLFAKEIAKDENSVIIWVPYTYGTGYQKSKIKTPGNILFENKYCNLINSKKMGNRPLCLVRPYNKSELESFIKNVEQELKTGIQIFKKTMGNVHFGDVFFPLKTKTSQEQLEYFLGLNLKKLKEIYYEGLDFKRFSDQCAHISSRLLREITKKELITVPIDALILRNTPWLEKVLDNYEEICSKVGSTIKIITDNFKRIGLNSCQHRYYADREYSKNEIIDLLTERKATISGNLFFALINSYGFQLTIGGKPTQTYYDSVFKSSQYISKIIGDEFQLRYVNHDLPNFSPIRNLREISAALRIVDKVVSRNVTLNGCFNFPEDIASHLSYIGGKDCVPEEFHKFRLYEGTPAIEKKRKILNKIKIMARSELSEVTLKPIKDIIPKDIPIEEIKYKLKEMDITLRMYISSLEMDIYYETLYLGGTLKNSFQEGVVINSGRYPTLFSMLLYGGTINNLEYNFIGSHNLFGLGTITSRNQVEKEFQSDKYKQVISYLLPETSLPKPIRDILFKIK